MICTNYATSARTASVLPSVAAGFGSSASTGSVSMADKISAEAFWMTSKLSVSSAALPWYRWM